MPIDTAWLDARIAAIQAQIEAYEAAILAFAQNGAKKSYTYNTGQQTIRVDRDDANMLSDVLSALYSQLGVLCARRDGSGSARHRGDW